MDELTAPRLEMSRARYQQNLAALQRQLAPSQLMVVMKDDAYGHGVEWAVDAAVEAATPVDLFGGYDVSTALRIRARAPQARIFVWVTSPDDEIRRALASDIDLGVGTLPYLRRIVAVARDVGTTARVHLKIDTGLHRNGVRPEDWPAFIAEAMAAQNDGVIDVVGVWSHLAEASDAEDDDAAAEFARAVASLESAGARPVARHLTASAASWWRPELRGSVSRIGAFCYGVRSADGPEIPGVAPVAALRAAVIDVLDDHVVISVGALHGIPSTIAGASVGTPGGARVLRHVGAVTSAVEVWPGARQGQDVTVFGPGADGESDATALAERIDTVGEEILTRLTPRVRRVVTD